MQARRRRLGVPSRAASAIARDARAMRVKVARAVGRGRDIELRLRLSPLGGQILAAMQRRGRASRHQVVDKLLRAHAQMALDEAPEKSGPRS